LGRASCPFPKNRIATPAAAMAGLLRKQQLDLACTDAEVLYISEAR